MSLVHHKSDQPMMNVEHCNIHNIILSLINAYVDIICGYGQAMKYVNCISMF
jgi:hypothetical protein